jgi:copper transport protein
MLLPLLFLASINRLLLTPRVRRGDAAALRWLRLSLGGEIALVLAIFAVVALWQFTPPPRQMAAASAQSPAGLRLQAHGPRGMAHLVVTPARPGPVQVAISVMDVQSRPWEVQAVELVLVDPQGRIEPIRRDAHRLTATTWQVDQLAIPAPGRWELQLDLLVSDFDKVSLHTSVELAAP